MRSLERRTEWLYFDGMESKSTTVYSSLEKKIARGEYKPGDRLPSESELCAQFNVSRGPVRAALDQLMAIGLIFKKKGGGSYISEQDPATYLNILRPGLRFHTTEYKEILVLRYALDKLSVELCVGNHDQNDYTELDSVMAAMEESRSPEELFALNRSFHTIISGLTGNQLLHNFNLVVWDLLTHCPRDELAAGNRDRQVEEHRSIYRAIKSRDVELAVLHSMRHLKRLVNHDTKKQDPSTNKHRWNPWLYDTM